MARYLSGRFVALPSTRHDYKSPASILCPPSVAIVGATERIGWPQAIFNNLRVAGYPGKIFPVNPRLSTVWGVPCFPDLASLPEAPSHALVIVPATGVIDVLEKGVAAGLKSATVYAANIGEGSDPEIVARGETLRALIKRSGLVVSGPNCMGGNAVRERFFSYPNPELTDIPLGSVACVSQSGGTLQHICQAGADRGVKFSYMLSSGNEIDLDLADFVNYFVDDEHTKVIALFIEGIRRPEMFMRAAARALAAGKPIIALKTGMSQQSREAAQSHTGAVSGDYDVFRAMCERYGIVHCNALDDMVELMLVFQGGRLPKGKRVGWVTTSGGTVDLLYDYLDGSRHIASPEFSDVTKAKIRDLVPAELALKNPLDAGIPSTAAKAAEMCIAVANDPNVDMLAWLGSLPTGKRKPDPALLKSIVAATDKPVVAFSRIAYILGADALPFQDDVGFPFLQSLPETVKALEGLAFYGQRAGRKVQPLPEPRGNGATLQGKALESALAAHGLTPPRSAFVTTPEHAAKEATRIGFPVVLKVVSPSFSHKTEIGGVKLDLRSADTVGSEAQALQDKIRQLDPSAKIEGFLVQEMVSGIEIILGARTDPLYGPMLIAGAGGIFVELMKDFAFRLLPVGQEDARDMLDELKVSKLLAGYRGKPPADVNALVKAICGLSDFYLNHRNLLTDFEINPLIVLANGHGVRAVDVRFVQR